MNQTLNQLAKQLREIWKQLGLNQRISVVLAAMAVLAVLTGLVFWSGRADYALLYGRLDEAEAAKVVAALDDAKIPYKITRGGGSITVPSDKVHLMRMQLAAKGIPRGDGVGFEIFDKPNFGISDFVQRANYLRAMQGELSRTIGQLEGVEAARVMIVIPENRLLVDNLKKPTASVFLKVRGQSQLPATSVNSIRFLVANSVEGLQANNVSVVDNLGNVLSETSEPDSAIGLSNSQLTARRNLEQYLGKKVEGMLDKVLGAGQAVVRVAADINFDTVVRTDEKFDPDGQVLRNSTVTDDSTETANASIGGGVPGTPTNANTDTNTAAGPTTSTKTKKKMTESKFEINKSVTNLNQLAGGLKRVSAAVFVAAKYEGTGADRKPITRSKEEMEKLRRVVQSALGIQLGENASRQDEITLEEMPFNDQPLIDMTQQLDSQEKKQFWFDLAQKLIYPALALGILFIFFRTLKKSAPQNIPLGIPLSELEGMASGSGNGNGNGHKNGDGRNGKDSEVVTVEVLNQLIRENPTNMTEALRSWMTRGNTN